MTVSLERATVEGQSESERLFPIRDRMGRHVINENGEGLMGAPLDRRSITKCYLGDLAYGTQISIGVEQLMDPEIGAAVEHTGKFWGNPYRRTAISLDPIMAVVYHPAPFAAGAYVKHLHKGIHGKDHKGRNFNALNPEAFYWAHETFRRGVQNMAENYSTKPFTDADREQLQHESHTWFSYYGMPMSMAPADYEANVEYRKNRIENVLEMTPSADRAINMALDRNPPRPESIPKPVWMLAKVALLPTTEVMSLLTIGELPDDIRKRFDIPFSEDQQGRLQEVRDVIRAFWTPLPDAMRYYPAAYDDRLRELNGKHKTWVDRLSYTGRSVGTAIVKRTVLPVLNSAQVARSRIAA